MPTHTDEQARPFDCYPREIRFLLRLRSLEREGIDRIVFSLREYALLEKIDSTPERLDYTRVQTAAGHA